MMAWLGGGWPAASPPKLTRVPAVFEMVTVMSRVPLLMRTSSPWMMGLMGHLCTGILLFAGWNCQIPSVLSRGIMQLISFAAERCGQKSIFINVVYPSECPNICERNKECVQGVAALCCFIHADWECAETTLFLKEGALNADLALAYLAFSASNPLDPSNLFFSGLQSANCMIRFWQSSVRCPP